MNLYEIEEQMEKCISEDGEVIDEELFDSLSLERDAKFENLALWTKNMKADIEAIKNEEQSLASRRKTIERKLDSVKNFLMYKLEGNKFTTPRVAVSYRKSQAVQTDDEFIAWASANADEYLSYKEPTVNKTAIKDAIKSGIEVPHATLEEKVSIQVK